MFTDRFIKFPILLSSDAERERYGDLNLPVPVIDSYVRFLPMQIESYYATYDAGDDSKDLVYTHVEMKSGDSFVVRTSVVEFEKLLNAFE